MKYGRVFRTTLREIGMVDLALYGPTVAHGIANKDFSAVKALAANDYVERKIGVGTGKARKVGKKLGLALRRARGLDESRVEIAALTEVATVNRMRDDIQRSGDYQAAGKIPFGIGENIQHKLEKRRLGSKIKTDVNKKLSQPRKEFAPTEGIPKAGAAEKADVKAMRKREMLRLKQQSKMTTGQLGRQALDKSYLAKKKLANIKDIAGKTKNNVPLPKWGERYGSFKTGMKALGGVAAIKGAKAITGAAEEVTKAASGGYAQMLQNTRMGMESAEKSGNLKENAKTWATRKAKYGPSGRKHRTWKFDFNKPAHVKKALALPTDSDIKKLMKSNADITKHEGMKTKSGIPVKFAYRSNNKKQLYAGKTIGMRQHTLSQHRKLGLPLPRGFQNWGYEKINTLFKKRQGADWYKGAYAKAPIHRKIMIGVGKIWKGFKKTLGMESDLVEEASLIESIPMPVVCTFMEGTVVSPTECDCPDCLAVTRRIREGEKLEEMAETSVPGTMLMAGTQGVKSLTANTPKRLSRKAMIAAGKKWKKRTVIGGPNGSNSSP